MILNDKSIRNWSIELDMVSPFVDENLQPASYDLTLGDTYIYPKYSNDIIDDGKEYIIVPPNEFMLCTTVEKVKIPYDLVGRVEGKSSLGRIGLLTHITAGFIDPGFEGNITLELKNIGPKSIALKKGCNIAQICFEELDEICTTPYNAEDNHYQYQDDVAPSRYEVRNNTYIVR